MRGTLPIAAAFLAGSMLTACTDDATTPQATTPAPTPSSSSPASPSTSRTSSSPARPSPVRVGAPAVLASNLAVPWGIAFLPDGSALVSERDSHRIVQVDARGQVSEVGVVPGVADDAGEGGLLGIALSPSFRQDPAVYAYLTSDTDNRVVRMAYGTANWMRHVSSSLASRKPGSTTAAGSRSGRTACST